jgi:hypothetical protein
MRLLPALILIFVLGAMVSPGDAAIVSLSQTAPAVDGADIAQLTGGSDIGSDQGHIWSNRPQQGQIFLTGSNPNGYSLNAITLQNLNNTISSNAFTFRVGTVAGTSFNPIRVENSTNAVSYVPLDYLTGTLAAPLSLAPNRLYGFDWGAPANGFVTANHLDSEGGDVFPSGRAYSSGANSVGSNTLTPRNGDRVFHLDMTANSQPASTGIFSVNFAGATTGEFGPFNVTGTAGVYPEPNWNNVANTTQLSPSGTNVPLIDSSGVTTSALITYSATNTWGTPSGQTTTEDGKLMKGYLDNAASATVTVSNLDWMFTTFGYRVVVYCDTDGAGTRGFRVTDNAGNVAEKWLLEGSTSMDFPGLTPDYVESLSLSDAAAAASGVYANYATLTGLTGSSFTFSFLNGTTGEGRSRINGFQVLSNMAVPEPSSLALAVFGVLGLGAWSLRRKGAAIA